MRVHPYGTLRRNSLELIELSSINKVDLAYVSSCSDTGSIGGDPCWIFGKSSLELMVIFFSHFLQDFPPYQNFDVQHDYVVAAGGPQVRIRKRGQGGTYSY